MRQLDLGRHRKARVWFDASAVPAYTPSAEVVRVVAATPGSLRDDRTAAVELFVPAGGRFLHGLLGGHFIPDQSDRLSIAASVTNGEQTDLTSSLAGGLDSVRVGLPATYADAAIRAIVDLQSESHFQSGHLAINQAAHGDAGSSPLVFKHLAIVLTKLLNLTQRELSDDDLLRIFPDRYD